MKGEFLHTVLKKKVKSGFKIIVATDNHSLNTKAISLFEDPPQLKNRYKHPKDPYGS